MRFGAGHGWKVGRVAEQNQEISFKTVIFYNILIMRDIPEILVAQSGGFPPDFDPIGRKSARWYYGTPKNGPKRR